MTDDVTSDSARKDRSCAGCLLAVLLVVVTVSIVVNRTFYPPEIVTITLPSTPNEADFLYVVADRPSGVKRLSWYYPPSLLGPGQIPADDEWIKDVARVGSGPFVRHIRWPSARRYGVVIHRRDGSWRLWWLDDRSLVGPTISRHLVGGGEALIRLPDASNAEVPSRELLDRLDLSRIHGDSDRPATVVPH
jgi:hypothetical protein